MGPWPLRRRQALPRLTRQLGDVQLATATLPAMLAQLERIRDDTANLPIVSNQLAGIAGSIVQVEDNTRSVQQLAEIALPLTGAAQRVGRLADRLPGRHRIDARDGSG